METVIAVALFGAAVIIAIYDKYDVERAYASLCADRHRTIPPLVDWFFTPDPDPDVERLRRTHRSLAILQALLAIVAVLLLLAHGVTLGSGS